MSAFLGFALLGASGCTTMKLIPAPTGGPRFQELQVDQRVRVLDQRGLTTDIKLTAVEPDFIEGRTKDGAVVRFETADVDELRERQFAPGRTAAVVAVSVFVLGALAAAEAGVLAMPL